MAANVLTCNMYMCRLRHIHDPVLLSLNMEGIRLLFFLVKYVGTRRCLSDAVRHIEHNEALCRRTEFCDLEIGLLRLVCFANRDFNPLFRRPFRSINRLIGTSFVVDYIPSF
jgi:hypothetical protein